MAVLPVGSFQGEESKSTNKAIATKMTESMEFLAE
jgi:hypothetical protein